MGRTRIYGIQMGLHGVILLAAFLVPLVLAGLSIYLRTRRWAAILAAISFLVAGFKCVGMETQGHATAGTLNALFAISDAVGHTMALFAAFIGMLASVALAIRPDRPRLP